MFLTALFVALSASAEAPGPLEGLIWVPIPVEQSERNSLIARTAGGPAITVTPIQGGSYAVRKRGDLLMLVKLNPDGGFKLQAIGESPTYVRPIWGGGYTIEQAGKSSIRVEPIRNGGYTIKTPGEEQTIMRPVWGGGFIIDPPDGPSTTVRPIGGGEIPDRAPVPVPVSLPE